MFYITLYVLLDSYSYHVVPFLFTYLPPFSGWSVVPVLYGFAVKGGWKGAIQGGALPLPLPLPLPARNFPRTAQTGGVGFW